MVITYSIKAIPKKGNRYELNFTGVLSEAIVMADECQAKYNDTVIVEKLTFRGFEVYKTETVYNARNKK
jgi:hypothetical protein